jgi:chromosome segregation ATPase
MTTKKEEPKKPVISVLEAQYLKEWFQNNVISPIEKFNQAVDFANDVEYTHKELNAQIPKLKEERDKLVADKAALQRDLDSTMARHVTGMATVATEAENTQKTLNAAVNAIRAKLRAAEEQHKSRMDEMEKEYRGRLETLKAQVAAEESKRDAAMRIKESAKAEVARL